MEQNTTLVHDGEIIEDLQFNGLKLIRRADLPTFGTDSVLLADFARLKPGERAIDLGTGTGILPVLLAGRRENVRIVGIELNEELADMAARSASLNALEARVQIMPLDINMAAKTLGHETFDAVVANPPYFTQGERSPCDARGMARHQQSYTLESLCTAAGQLLKNGGKLFMVYPAAMLTGALCALREVKIEPKRICLVCPKPGKPPKLMLIEGRKGGGSGLSFESLTLLNEDGSYTRELKRIYHMEQEAL